MNKAKTAYADGFVLVVPQNKLREYKRIAAMAEKIWRKYGALDYKEFIGDDLKSEWGLPFPKLVKMKPNETVIFSYILYKSRAHRNSVNAKVMKDPAMNDPKYQDKPMPFDEKRMAYGGFKVLVG
jgi:uncharacterized protein YbaA (DUF1428 family)